MTTPVMPVIPVADILQNASPARAPTVELAQQFARAMETAPVPQAGEDAGASVVAKAVLGQDQAMRDLNDHVRQMALAYGSGDDAALDVGRQIELFHQISSVNFQFNATVQVAQSAKNGLQTLIRNQ